MKKKKRHEMILQLIEEFTISTQDELLEKLNERGFDVTQATVSRDIRDLRIMKSADAAGNYHYSVGTNEPDEFLSNFNAIFRQSVLSADFVGNIIVIRCCNGMAQAACAAFDTMEWEGLVGTIAGDDTIFALCRTEGNATQLKDSIQKILKQNK